MTILLLDDDYIIVEQLKCLLQLDNKWKLIKSDEIGDYNNIDLVIVDVFDKRYKQILEDIIDFNPKIRTITVSDKLASNYDKGCEECSCNYNRIRLIKPIKLKLLFNTINQFDEIETCPLKDAFHNLENLIPIVIKQFRNLLYNEELQTISSTGDIESKEHIYPLNFFNICQNVNTHYKRYLETFSIPGR